MPDADDSFDDIGVTSTYVVTNNLFTKCENTDDYPITYKDSSFKPISETIKSNFNANPNFVSNSDISFTQPTFLQKINFTKTSLVKQDDNNFAESKSHIPSFFRSIGADPENLHFAIENHSTKKLSNVTYKFDDKKIKNKDLYGYFITISPSHNDDLESIINLLTKCAKEISKLKGVSEYFYVYEHTGTWDDMYHPHLHILVKRKSGDRYGAPKKLKDIIINICDRLFNVKCNIEIKHVVCNSENDFIKYMKKSDPKYAMIRGHNKLLRNKFNLKTYYTGC